MNWSLMDFGCQCGTQNPQITFCGWKGHKGHVLGTIEFQATAVTLWHNFGHFGKQKVSLPTGCFQDSSNLPKLKWTVIS